MDFVEFIIEIDAIAVRPPVVSYDFCFNAMDLTNWELFVSDEWEK
jgi:hypothetical protein